MCCPPAVERWLIGRVRSDGEVFSTHEALGIGAEGRIAASGVVDTLRERWSAQPFLERNRLLQLVRHDALAGIEVVRELDGLPYRICRTPSEPTARELTAQGSLSPDLVEGVARSLLEALGAIHRAGLVHGNVSLDSVHVSMLGSDARAIVARPAPLAEEADAACDLAAAGWVLVSLLGERPVPAWHRHGGVKRLVVRLLDPSIPTSARSAIEALERGPTEKVGIRRMLSGLVG